MPGRTGTGLVSCQSIARSGPKTLFVYRVRRRHTKNGLQKGRQLVVNNGEVKLKVYCHANAFLETQFTYQLLDCFPHRNRSPDCCVRCPQMFPTDQLKTVPTRKSRPLACMRPLAAAPSMTRVSNVLHCVIADASAPRLPSSNLQSVRSSVLRPVLPPNAAQNAEPLAPNRMAEDTSRT